MDININPNQDLYKWGPIDGRLIYPDYFNLGFMRFHKKFSGFSWSDVLGLFQNGKMTYIWDPADLAYQGKKVFQHFILNDANFKQSYARWKKITSQLLAIQSKASKGLKNISDRELAQLYGHWAEKYLEFWTFGLIPEVANYGADPWLHDLLKSHVPAQAFAEIYEKLSAPAEPSFYKKAELELLQLYKYRSNPDLLNRKLKQHQAKYFWNLNSYGRSRVLSPAYFKRELLSHSAPAVTKALKQLASWSLRVRQNKRKLIREFNIAPRIVKIADRMAATIAWQDIRKYYIFLANHHIDMFLQEIAVRNRINFDDLHLLSVSEIKDLFESGKRPPAPEITARKQALVVWYSQKSNSLKYISGTAAQKIITSYTRERFNRATQIKGVTVSPGKTVRARVRIIDSAGKIKTMKRGEILVSPMTSPDYIVAMKMAKAIITDAGGMTSHAAVVSRELRIPCIVGTRIATKIFKNGDMVEVDVHKGIVRKIK
jgi:phosphohistidine swiveling domain-containing protein